MTDPDDLLAELRGVATYGRTHHSTLWGTHCDLCGMRMPCDWADAGITAEQAADRIDELERELAREREAYDDIAHELENETGVVMEQRDRITELEESIGRHFLHLHSVTPWTHIIINDDGDLMTTDEVMGGDNEVFER